MKNSLLIFALALFCLNGMAQDETISEELNRKNVIKILPINYVLNSYSLEYERMINPKNSFEFGIGLPSNQSMTDKYSYIDWSEDDQFTNDKLKILSLRAAYRHYTGKSNLPKGFYMAPFLKYQNVEATANRRHTEVEPEETIITNENYDFKINTFSLGFQIGYQFLIAKRVTLDLYFPGLEFGLGKVDATIKSDDFEAIGDIENDVNDAIDDLPSFVGDKIKVTSTSNSVNFKGSSIPYPWLRGGFSIGIAF